MGTYHVVKVCRGGCPVWDHVVGVCRGERVSVSCKYVVGTALGCRGNTDTGFVLGSCRGSVSWRMCREHLRKVLWERDFVSCYENENIYL